MSLPPWLRALLPRPTHRAWDALRDLVPSEAYLVGDTALGHPTCAMATGVADWPSSWGGKARHPGRAAEAVVD